MTVADRVLGVIVGAGVLAGVVWLSNAAITAHPSDEAVLRVAFSAVPERVETCREPGADELARLPAHMRQRVICEGTTASYRLTIRVGGRLLADRVVRAGGLRHDRRLFVLDEIPVPAVDADLEVRIDRIEQETGPTTTAGPRDRLAQVRDAVPPHLARRARIAFAPRRVVLVTYEPRQRALAIVRGMPDAGLTP